MEDAAKAGQWCVGYVRYEAASAFDKALLTHAAQGPLAWFAVYDEALAWPRLAVDPIPEDGLASVTTPLELNWRNPCTRAQFDQAFATLTQAIARGA